MDIDPIEKLLSQAFQDPKAHENYRDFSGAADENSRLRNQKWLLAASQIIERMGIRTYPLPHNNPDEGYWDSLIKTHLNELHITSGARTPRYHLGRTLELPTLQRSSVLGEISYQPLIPKPLGENTHIELTTKILADGPAEGLSVYLEAGSENHYRFRALYDNQGRLTNLGMPRYSMLEAAARERLFASHLDALPESFDPKDLFAQTTQAAQEALDERSIHPYYWFFLFTNSPRTRVWQFEEELLDGIVRQDKYPNQSALPIVAPGQRIKDGNGFDALFLKDATKTSVKTFEKDGSLALGVVLPNQVDMNEFKNLLVARDKSWTGISRLVPMEVEAPAFNINFKIPN